MSRLAVSNGRGGVSFVFRPLDTPTDSSDDPLLVATIADQIMRFDSMRITFLSLEKPNFPRTWDA